MDVIAAFVIGYWFGIRQGRTGYERLADSLKTILGSQEVRQLSTTAVTRAAELVSKSDLGTAVLQAVVARMFKPRR